MKSTTLYCTRCKQDVDKKFIKKRNTFCDPCCQEIDALIKKEDYIWENGVQVFLTDSYLGMNAGWPFNENHYGDWHHVKACENTSKFTIGE